MNRLLSELLHIRILYVEKNNLHGLMGFWLLRGQHTGLSRRACRLQEDKMSDEELGKMVSFSFQFLARFLPLYPLFPPPVYGDGDPIL